MNAHARAKQTEVHVYHCPDCGHVEADPELPWWECRCGASMDALTLMVEAEDLQDIRAV